MKLSVRRWRRRLYNPDNGWIDAHSRFADLVRSHLRADMRVLNLGAGCGNDSCVNFEHHGGWIVGLDPERTIAVNSHVHGRVVGVGERMPFSAECFDVVYSDWVVEHLQDPRAVVREVFRVLKPGGFFIFRTGNLRHYVYLIAAFTPHWFHQLVAERVLGSSGVGDEVFPTYYRLNSPRAIRHSMEQAGFVEHEFAMVEPEPAYLCFSIPTLLVGAAYERVLNRYSSLAGIRANINACFQKAL